MHRHAASQPPTSLLSDDTFQVCSSYLYVGRKYLYIAGASKDKGKFRVLEFNRRRLGELLVRELPGTMSCLFAIYNPSLTPLGVMTEAVSFRKINELIENTGDTIEVMRKAVAITGKSLRWVRAMLIC